MMNSDEPKWFEKTVEYAFVRRFADFLACRIFNKSCFKSLFP